jgi:hypothetical protein
VNTPLGTSQQSVPGMQHCVPQQNSLEGQATPWHGGFEHVPLSQYGFVPPHLMPQPPQLRMSLFSYTHAPLQHVSPSPHGIGQMLPLLLDALVVVVVLLALLVVGPVDMQHERQAGL